MKKTTYIMIGMLIGSICLIVGGIAFLSTQGSQRKSGDVYFVAQGEPKTMPLPACKYVSIKREGVEYKQIKEGLYEIYNNFAITDGSKLIVTDGNESYPELKIASDLEPLIHHRLSGDTLIIALSVPHDFLPEKLSKSDYLFISTLPLELKLPKDALLAEVESGLLRSVDLTNMERSSFLIDSDVNCSINDCIFDTLRVENVRKIDLMTGKADNLYVNCDRVNSWGVHPEFQVDTEYLSGSGIANNQLHANECRRVIWTPTGENAKLNVEFSCPVEILVKE